MNGSIVEVDAQRARWERYRERERLVPEAADDFARAGLGRHGEDLDLRLTFLPADPEAAVVPLDASVIEWLKDHRTAPFGGNSPWWGHHDTVTSRAAVLYDRYRDDGGWARYLAVHRHGGVELGLGSFAYGQNPRIFPLRAMVGLAWIAVALQREVAERWSVDNPLELTVALRNTAGATLGSFADGWTEPHDGLGRYTTCLDDHVILRWELDDDPAPEELAYEVGDRLENSFGSTERRYRANRGDFVGRFDPRFSL